MARSAKLEVGSGNRWSLEVLILSKPALAKSMAATSTLDFGDPGSRALG